MLLKGCVFIPYVKSTINVHTEKEEVVMFRGKVATLWIVAWCFTDYLIIKMLSLEFVYI